MRLRSRLFSKLSTDLKELFAFVGLRFFAYSLVAIFIPIFFLKLGLGFDYVLIFLILLHFFQGFTGLLAAKVSEKIGLKIVLLFSAVFSIIFLLLLYTFAAYRWPVWLMAGFASLVAGFFYVGYYSYFICLQKKGEEGEEDATVRQAITVAQLSAPMIGGLIISFFSFDMLFICSIALFFVSLIPVILLKRLNLKLEFSVSDLFNKKIDGLMFVLFGEGGRQFIDDMIWPVFLYVIIGLEYVVGIIFTVASLLSILSLRHAGAKVDSKQSGKMLKDGSILTAAVFVVRYFFLDVISLGLGSIAGRVLAPLIFVPQDKVYFDTAKENNTLEIVVLRLTAVGFGFSAVGILMLIAPFDMMGKMFVGFACAAVMVLFNLSLKQKN